ncbi:MAG: D-2-hydroxyacid dehydrogenase [Bacteroidetes bacterium]|uniref:D-2-hydroxyacid dehydrogenase n=1 Tax=Candidatus Merdivivens pullistercoris TaxID=2840873 RepID=A0A9D9I3G7_9BACT|nr:D-2-hydroxyacid dehydrogenase [Candidatus Merdivivens pullistercoris]
MKIVFLDSDTMGDVSFAPIAEKGELILYPRSTPQQAIERVKDCEVLIVNKIIVNKELVDAAPKLRLICEAATGVNNIDIEYARSKGIPVRNAAGYSTESVAQVTFMHILNLVGHASYFDRRVKTGEYYENGIFSDMSWPFFELKGKKLGIIGMGNIGQRVARIAVAFGMEVAYYSTSGTSHCKDYPSLPLEDLLSVSDIVTIHAPLNDATRNLVTYDRLKLMKPSAYILNMGRGGIINEQDLADALSDNIIAGAATDVYAREPLEPGHPYLKFKDYTDKDGRCLKEKLLLTPHIAWTSDEALKTLVEKIAENIYLQ